MRPAETFNVFDTHAVSAVSVAVDTGFAIFAALIEPDFLRLIVFAQLFHEVLEMSHDQRATHWQTVRAVRQRNKAIRRPKARFMHATYSPLLRSIDSATDAMPTRQGNYFPGRFRTPERYPAPRYFVRLDWVKARQLHLQHEAAARRRRGEILPVGFFCVLGEV